MQFLVIAFLSDSLILALIRSLAIPSVRTKLILDQRKDIQKIAMYYIFEAFSEAWF